MITNDKYVTRDLPILALRGITMFPDVFMAFNIERNQSHAALKAAESTDYDLFLVTQRDVSCDAPGQDDLYEKTVPPAECFLFLPGMCWIREAQSPPAVFRTFSTARTAF